MTLLLASSTNMLQIVRQRTDAIGVAVSFGKDSLATLDLCCRLFVRVEAYYLYRVAGMSIVEEWTEQVRRRCGVAVRPYPHFDLSRCYRNAVCQPHWKTLGTAPTIDMTDIEVQFRHDSGVDWIAYGWRKNDSFSRALIMKQCGGMDFKARRIFPLRIWKRDEVYAYLDSRGIPRPPKLGRAEQGGLDFHPEALAELKDKYPDDYAMWMRDFPFSEVTVRRQNSPFYKRARKGKDATPSVGA